MKKKKALLVALGYPIIILLTIVAIILGGKNYTVCVPNPYHSEKVALTYSEEGIVKNTKTRFTEEYAVFTFRSVKTGSVLVRATVFDDENDKVNTTAVCEFSVLPTGVLYMSGYDYGGFQYTLLGMALISLYTCIICVVQLQKRKGNRFFSHKTMLDLALAVFFGLSALIYFGLLLGCLILRDRIDSWQVYNLAGFSMSAIFGISIPFIVLFAGFMSFSNLSLIRHEGFRRNNLFGIFISLVLFVGSLLCVIAILRNPNSTNVELTEVRDAVIRAILSSAFVYFESVLFAAMICTRYAARHEPEYNKDFIIILGCKVGRDGKPLPLLRGRIDRAIAFYRKQFEATGKQACFIPSGGKGSDEVISEAECMKNYLLEQGIEETLIYPETESTTTLENMRFSKQIADKHKKDANIVFSTTNYHVFRSGIFSAKAGMKADGIGAKTKWYFWPNAQMREFIGLLVSEWKINVLLIAAIVGVSTLFANITTIISWIVK